MAEQAKQIQLYNPNQDKHCYRKIYYQVTQGYLRVTNAIEQLIINLLSYTLMIILTELVVGLISKTNNNNDSIHYDGMWKMNS